MEGAEFRYKAVSLSTFAPSEPQPDNLILNPFSLPESTGLSQEETREPEEREQEKALEIETSVPSAESDKGTIQPQRDESETELSETELSEKKEEIPVQAKLNSEKPAPEKPDIVHPESTAIQMNKDFRTRAFTRSSTLDHGENSSPSLAQLKADITASKSTQTTQEIGNQQLSENSSRISESNKETIQTKTKPTTSPDLPPYKGSASQFLENPSPKISDTNSSNLVQKVPESGENQSGQESGTTEAQSGQEIRGSQEVIVQRQPAPQGEKAEMTPEEREAIEAIYESGRLMKLGLNLLNEENYQQALQYFEKAIKLWSENSYFWVFKAEALFGLGRYQEAIDASDTALFLDEFLFKEDASWAWNHRGNALRQLHRYDEALQSYQQAVKVDPENTKAQNNLSNLENLLAENPSLRNQQQQNSEADGGNNPFKILFGALQGEWNENQTLPVATVGLLISLIPVIGQFADARDLAAYAYRIIFKKQYKDPLTWFGLTLSLVGVVPLVGDLAKFIGKNYKLLKESLSISGKLEEVLQGIRAISPDFLDLANVKRLVAENWPEAVTNGTAKWNTALDQLSQWLNNIPDFLFAKEQQELAEIIKELRSQSDGMLSGAFNEIKRKIDEILDEIGRLLNPQGELVTPEGVKVPSNGVDGGIQGPMRIEGSEQSPSPHNTRFLNVEEAREFIARKIASGERITLDLFGGRISQIPGAVNIDLVAEDGIRATIADLARIFPDNSVDEIVASGPQAEFLEDVARMVKPGGHIYINANFSNRYRFGTSRGKKPPNAETLERLGLRLVKDEGSLDPRFGDLEFRRTDGGEIPRGTVKTIIFEKVE